MATTRTTKTKRVVATPPTEGATSKAPARKGRVSLRGAEMPFFAKVNDNLEFISSGAAVMDCALGGGWCLGRISNVVGDRSAGKTLLAIEACANFHQAFPDGLIFYGETESAFDENYAAALGMPVDAIDFGNKDQPLRTVEDWYHSAEAFLQRCQKEKKRGLYILDSFDALSDDAEMKRDIDDGSYGAGKAKKSGELFRRLVDQIESSQVHMMVVSQIRDKLNVTFGETKTRSGGRALDFYASQIVWLAEIGKIKKTASKIERVVGVNVRANVKKNKVGLPFRTCDYPIYFGYGIDDLTASVEWLQSIGSHDLLRDKLDLSEKGYKIRIAHLRDQSGAQIREFRTTLQDLVRREWSRVDQLFLPKGSKYG